MAKIIAKKVAAINWFWMSICPFKNIYNSSPTIIVTEIFSESFVEIDLEIVAINKTIKALIQMEI